MVCCIELMFNIFGQRIMLVIVQASVFCPPSSYGAVALVEVYWGECLPSVSDGVL